MFSVNPPEAQKQLTIGYTYVTLNIPLIIIVKPQSCKVRIIQV